MKTISHINIINPGTQGSKKGYTLEIESDEDTKKKKLKEERLKKQLAEEEEKWNTAQETTDREFFTVIWEYKKVNSKRGKQPIGRGYTSGQPCYLIPDKEQKGGCRNVRAGQISSCRLTHLRPLAGSYENKPIYTVDVISIRDMLETVPIKSEILSVKLKTVQKKSQLLPNEVIIKKGINKTCIITGSKQAAANIKDRLFAEMQVRWFTDPTGFQLSVLEVLTKNKIKKIKNIIREIEIKIETRIKEM